MFDDYRTPKAWGDRTVWNYKGREGGALDEEAAHVRVLIFSVIIYIQKFLQSDWWRASQFILNAVQKCEIECRKLKLVQKR